MGPGAGMCGRGGVSVALWGRQQQHVDEKVFLFIHLEIFDGDIVCHMP